jgi:catechol 2,3-dioxygenase
VRDRVGVGLAGMSDRVDERDFSSISPAPQGLATYSVEEFGMGQSSASWVTVGRIRHLCLRVRDLQRSVDFYCGVLGFEERQDEGREPLARICRCFDDETGAPFELILTQGLPPDDHLVGLDHLGFDTRSPERVDRIYRRALESSSRAARPRLENGRWKTYLFDPDGYKIEISAQEPDAGMRETSIGGG